MDTGIVAKVWFTVDDMPRTRSVYSDGRSWLVRDRHNRSLVPIDDAMGWVLVDEGRRPKQIERKYDR